jgi:hypothetical protein
VQQAAELKKAKLAAYEVRCDAGLAYQESRVARQVALQAKTEEARKLAAVKIDLGKRLAWPLALRRPELSDKRAELESAIHRLTHYTRTSGVEGMVEVQQRIAELYSHLRELRNDQQVLFEDLVAAKKYLNGLELAAESFIANSNVERLASKD